MRWNIIILSLFLISLASATPSLNFQHNETQPGETILATINGSSFAKQIENSDISFYEGRKKISLESDIVFYNGTYYLFAYPTREGNFSMQIADVLYREGEEVKSITLTKQIEVKANLILDKKTNETSKQILSIKPGFIFTSSIPKIKLINMGTSGLNLTYNNSELSLSPGQTKEITIVPKNTFSYLNISSYKKFSIPIILIDENNSKNELNPTFNDNINLIANPIRVSIEASVNNETISKIQLFNKGNKTMDKIKIDSDIDFEKVEIPNNISGRQSENLTIYFLPKELGYFEGHLNITYSENKSENKLSIPINLSVLPQGESIKNITFSKEKCEDIGKVCATNELCNGTAKFANGEYCCLDTCVLNSKNKKNGGSWGWLIGLLILVGLGYGGYYLYKKQKSMPSENSGKKLKEISEKYKQRMSGRTSDRISGKLSKS